MQALINLIRLGGVMHLGILTAGPAMTVVLDWKRELRRLNELSRHVIWVHASFVFLMLIAFGVASLALAPRLASGDLLARAVCGFIALFWSFRLVIQFFVFDARPYLGPLWLRVGYHGLTVVFIYFALVYTLAAVHG